MGQKDVISSFAACIKSSCKRTGDNALGINVSSKSKQQL